MRKKGFTLLEILIVVVLFSLLIGVIFQSYITISQASFKLEREKQVGKEYLILSQVLSNISEEATIDYTKYESNLITTNGISDVLYLTGTNREGASIYSSGENCWDANVFLWEFEEKREDFYNLQRDPGYFCELVLDQNGIQTSLIDNSNIIQSKMYFKIIPYDSNKNILYLQDKELRMGQPGFWVLGTIAGRFYNPKKRTNDTILPLQLFYTLNGSTESLYQ